ncbi:ABC transporter ATP-binding protein [Cellulomonas sp. RIT-PI-Y]|uniref:ABC transporter ATP-binding protein n=1 Tax=Cellulomonas sp. RIT-PI-Y TaxID=3035297 RepID=UPI0021D929D2|nr:ABC transporter ATP-binding protein [Cellulomonas sp. RIT-PI-Y]
MALSEHFGPDVQVAVDEVHVRYRTASDDAGLRRSLPRWQRAANRVIGREPTVLVRALAGVSLVARAGDAVGIVGLNGSGKSTLLRIIAGLEHPDRGQARARSTPVLLGVNAALLPELSGRQNVHLGCLAMGMTPAQAEAAYPTVVEVAGIGASIHRPMKTYSSGMAARLKFAIAAASEPQILLIDEALATGDAAFRDRSEERMKLLRQNAGCVFLVSHAAKTVEETCTRAIWLHHGRVVTDGPAYEVAQAYRWWAWNLAKGETEKAAGLLEDAFRQGVDTQIVLSPADATHVVPRHARR